MSQYRIYESKGWWYVYTDYVYGIGYFVPNYLLLVTQNERDLKPYRKKTK